MRPLLHDVVEDTEYTREDIEANFGSKIASIVEGPDKRFREEYSATKPPLQAENFRKAPAVDEYRHPGGAHHQDG